MSNDSIADPFHRLGHQVAALTAAFVEFGEIVRDHLSAVEARADYIAFGPEPSDRVNTLVTQLREVAADEQTELRICIDADCPSCKWGERWFSPARQLFGCSKCPYTSTERNA